MRAKVGLDRRRVVDAAAELVDASGLDALTMKRLAATLDVRYQSLSFHVGSRTKLLTLLQERYLHGVGEATQRAAVGRSGRDALEAVAAAHLTYDLEHPGLLAVHWKLGNRGAHAPDDDGAAEVIRAVLVAGGYEGQAVVHSQRILSTAMLAFASLYQAGMICRNTDPAEAHRTLIGIVLDAIDRGA